MSSVGLQQGRLAPRLSRAIWQAGVVGTIAGAGTYLVTRAGGVLTLGDILAVSALSAAAGGALLSFLRGPGQFATALWERIVFVVWVPVACVLIIALFAFRIFALMMKLAVKAIITLIGIVAYVVFPVDLIPDILLGLGQIDDLIVTIALVSWFMSAGISAELKDSIQSRRPSTPFP